MPMNRLTVIPAYIQSTRDVMTKELIKKAFEKTGLHPVNRQIFAEEDFAPSKASSTVAHVPSSFPADFPSSDPAEASHDDGTQSESDPSDLDGDFFPQDEDLEGMSIDKCFSDLLAKTVLTQMNQVMKAFPVRRMRQSKAPK